MHFQKLVFASPCYSMDRMAKRELDHLELPLLTFFVQMTFRFYVSPQINSF